MKNEYKKILKMIENVDAKDAKTLDEIDIAVLRYRSGADVHIVEREYDGGIYACDANREEVDIGYIQYHELFVTRSRDALKSIRPDGWRIKIEKIYSPKGITDPERVFDWYCVMQGNDRGKPSYHIIPACSMQTEELAELHTIIQAIEYER